MKHLAILLLAFFVCSVHSAPGPQVQPFEFHHEGLTYSGEVMLPKQAGKGVIVVIPGHGSTALVGGPQFLQLRRFLVAQGYSVAYWDKAGCGLSEGEYDHNQSIISSAEEAVAALAVIRQLDLSNGDHLGFWSISRGGWIVPAITERFAGTRFWISVSGTTELDNGRYMLEANLRALKRDPKEVDLLMSQWDDYQRILVRGGSFEEFMASTEQLMADPYFNADDFEMTAEGLADIQRYIQSGVLQFDQRTNLAIMYPNFEATLTAMGIPVLAMLGRKDTQVDWQATGRLYARAARGGAMQLTTVYLDDCNHVMQRSVTGSIHENLPPDTPACAGYYESIEEWLHALGADAGDDS